jgi:hypothetical protein
VKTAVCCPVHNVEPVCEKVILRKSGCRLYIDRDGNERKYKVKGLSYYKVRCPVCYENNAASSIATTANGTTLALGVAGKTRNKAVAAWNAFVGDIQLNRFVLSVNGKAEA